MRSLNVETEWGVLWRDSLTEFQWLSEERKLSIGSARKQSDEIGTNTRANKTAPNALNLILWRQRCLIAALKNGLNGRDSSERFQRFSNGTNSDSSNSDFNSDSNRPTRSTSFSAFSPNPTNSMAHPRSSIRSINWTPLDSLTWS